MEKNDNNKLYYNPEINIPQPNDNNTINYKLLNNDTKITDVNFLNNLNINYDINKTNNNNSEQLNNIPKQNKYADIKYNLNHSINTNYKNINKKNIYCFWDTHSFEGQIYGLPIKRENDEIYIFGTFCCPECVAAYNFNVLNDNNMGKI